jgi:hypothetical protein
MSIEESMFDMVSFFRCKKNTTSTCCSSNIQMCIPLCVFLFLMIKIMNFQRWTFSSYYSVNVIVITETLNSFRYQVEDSGNLGRIETFQYVFKNIPLLEEKQFRIFFFSFLMLLRRLNITIELRSLALYVKKKREFESYDELSYWYTLINLESRYIISFGQLILFIFGFHAVTSVKLHLNI